MVPLFQLITILTIHFSRPREKESGDVEIQIRESREFGTCDTPVITVKPDRPKRVTSTKFTSRNQYSLRPSTLNVYVNGIYSGMYIQPEEFARYAKIVFSVEANEIGQWRLVSIDGVEPLALDNVTRFGLLNIFRANAYEGRKLEQIAGLVI